MWEMYVTHGVYIKLIDMAKPMLNQAPIAYVVLEWSIDLNHMASKLCLNLCHMTSKLSLYLSCT